MINLVKDEKILQQKSSPVTDISPQINEFITKAQEIIHDSRQDNNPYHPNICIGLSGIQLNIPLQILAACPLGTMPLFMCNPIITEQSGPYDTEETCMSLIGARPCKRYKSITVTYQDPTKELATRTRTFNNLWAQIIQHEMDHFEGKLI